MGRLELNREILSNLRNKLTVPMVALERLERGKRVPTEFLKLAVKELDQGGALIQKFSLSMEKDRGVLASFALSIQNIDVRIHHYFI